MENQEMIIDRMQIEDYDVIYQIWSSEKGITLRAIDDSREGIEKFLLRNPKSNFVCRADGKIVGCILAGHDGRKGFIYHAVVIDTYRKKGIGKKLVTKVIASLQEEDITKVAILVNSDNLSGSRYWESLGFEYFDDIDYRILRINELNI